MAAAVPRGADQDGAFHLGLGSVLFMSPLQEKLVFGRPPVKADCAG